MPLAMVVLSVYGVCKNASWIVGLRTTENDFSQFGGLRSKIKVQV